MGRSLKKRKPKKHLTITVGQYLVTRRSKSFGVKGSGDKARDRKFSLWEKAPGRWRVSLMRADGERIRRKFPAPHLQEAIKQVESLVYGEAHQRSAGEMLVSEVFESWLKTLTCSEKTRERYRAETISKPKTESFTDWVKARGIKRWVDLRPSHIQEYANELADRGLTYDTIRLAVFPVRSCAKWACIEWPMFRNVGAGFKMPVDRESRLYDSESEALSLRQAGDFILWLRDVSRGWTVLPGVALQSICALRLSEVLRLKWDRIDLKAGSVTIEQSVKTLSSVRRIPVPGLVLEVLLEAPKNGTNLLPDFNGDAAESSYSKAVRRFMREWDSDVDVRPGDLRDTLQTEGEIRGWQGYVLDRYCGHVGQSIRRKHYTKPGKAKLLSEMRRQVTDRVDEILADHRRSWNAWKANVISLEKVNSGAQSGPLEGSPTHKVTKAGL